MTAGEVIVTADAIIVLDIMTVEDAFTLGRMLGLADGTILGIMLGAADAMAGDGAAEGRMLATAGDGVPAHKVSPLAAKADVKAA